MMRVRGSSSVGVMVIGFIGEIHSLFSNGS